MKDSPEIISKRLAKVELFQELTKEELFLFMPVVEMESFPAGHAIVKEGEKGDSMYIVNKGDVEIQKKTLNGDPYTCDYLPESLHLFFGEFSLLDNDVRSATVRAVTDVEVYTIRREPFETYCEKNRVAGYKIMKSLSKRLCRRLRKADSEILILFEALVEEIGR